MNLEKKEKKKKQYLTLIVKNFFNVKMLIFFFILSVLQLLSDPGQLTKGLSKHTHTSCFQSPGGTSQQRATGYLLLDGVAFS